MAENDVSDRYVLRRIHKSHFHPGASLEIDPAAFRPSKDDHDGLSVSFENEISADDLAAFARQPAENYGVVRFGIAELEQLGLTIQRDTADDAPAGHAFIPEINTNDYASSRELKRKLKDLGFQLARLASRGIVRRPTSGDG
jgi:hypothetical protein